MLLTLKFQDMFISKKFFFSRSGRDRFRCLKVTHGKTLGMLGFEQTLGMFGFKQMFEDVRYLGFEHKLTEID